MNPDQLRTMKALASLKGVDTNSPAVRVGQHEKQRAEIEYRSWLAALSTRPEAA
jgi:hypothetical protein